MRTTSHFSAAPGGELHRGHRRALTCRWHNSSLILDVMGIDEAAFGFTNRWYASAIKQYINDTLTRL